MSSAIKTQSVPAADRILTILELVGQSKRGLRLAEVAEQAKMPRSSAHCLLLTLERRGYLHRHEKSGRYMFGLKLFSLASYAINGLEVRELAASHLAALMQQTGLTVHMAIRQHKQAVLIAKLEPLGQPTVGTWVGRAMDLNSTASGKALIAHLPDAELAQIFSSRAFVRHNHFTIVQVSHLRRELAAVRECGYALDNEEDELGVRCVGAPIFELRRVVAAISVAGSLDQLGENRIGSIAARLKQAALLISAQLSRKHGTAAANLEI